jgi:ATP-dependent DNA helicase 2 subunit 2
MALSDASCIIAQKGNDRAQIALSSLIHALFENEMYALARLVPKDDRNPILIMMGPSIENNIECLVDVQVRPSHAVVTLGPIRGRHSSLHLCSAG